MINSRASRMNSMRKKRKLTKLTAVDEVEQKAESQRKEIESLHATIDALQDDKKTLCKKNECLEEKNESPTV